MNQKIEIGDKEIELTLKQRLFCEYYVSEEYFGNAVQAYIKAYQPDQTKANWYKTAKACASENLSKPNLCSYINSLLEQEGLNDLFVDKQLLFLMSQHSDLGVKLNAI